MCGNSDTAEAGVSSITEPSAGLRFSSSMAMRPLAPALLSTSATLA